MEKDSLGLELIGSKYINSSLQNSVTFNNYFSLTDEYNHNKVKSNPEQAESESVDVNVITQNINREHKMSIKVSINRKL